MKVKDWLYWGATVFLAMFFVLVLVAMARTMTANDSVFDEPVSQRGR